jgi:hypothetical protein
MPKRRYFHQMRISIAPGLVFLREDGMRSDDVLSRTSAVDDGNARTLLQVEVMFKVRAYILQRVIVNRCMINLDSGLFHKHPSDKARIVLFKQVEHLIEKPNRITLFSVAGAHSFLA